MAPAKNSGSPSPALPLARAQDGAAAGGNGCRSGVCAALGFALAGLRSGAATLSPRSGSWVGEQLEIGANHRGMMSLVRRFVTFCGEESAPLVVVWGCPIMLPYRT